jgi:hypothetical protein
MPSDRGVRGHSLGARCGKREMTHKEEDVADCTPLGPVVGLTDSNYVSDERREMQNQAVDLGADTLLLTREIDPPKGTAYRCKPLAPKGIIRGNLEAGSPQAAGHQIVLRALIPWSFSS